MSHFAKVENGIVTQVIVAEQAFVDFQQGSWFQTSYNTRGGVHYGPDGQPDGGIALRKNFAGKDYAYDAQRDAFIPPCPFPSWTLNEETCLWLPPTPMPDDGQPYDWDETSLSWILIS